MLAFRVGVRSCKSWLYCSVVLMFIVGRVGISQVVGSLVPVWNTRIESGCQLNPGAVLVLEGI